MSISQEPLAEAPMPKVALHAAADALPLVETHNSEGKGGMAKLTPALKAVAFAARTLDAVAPTLATELMLRHFMRPRRKRRSSPHARLYANAQRLSIRFRDQDLALWHWGDRGPAVLLVHGWEDSSASMLPFVEPLLSLGYRVMALDSPGHGLSGAGATHLLDNSFALEQAAFEFGPFESIVAHSFGATAVCLMLSRTPDWHPGRLTLLSPMRDMEQHLQIFADIACLSPQRMDRLRRRVTEVVGSSPESLNAFDALPRLSIPGLVIHDRHDPVIPHTVGESVAASWPGAAFVSTRHLGHRRILKCPNVLAEVVRLHAGS